MKKVVFLIIFLLCKTAWCQDSELRVLTEDYPPYGYENNGEVVGFVTEIVEVIFQITEIDKPVIEIHPWKRAYQTALSTPNVLIYMMTRTKQREHMFRWVGPVAERTNWIWKLRERADISISSLDDAKKYTLVSTLDTAIARYLTKNGFNMHFARKTDLVFTRFLRGREDLVASPKVPMFYFLKSVGKSTDLVEPIFPIPSDGDYYLAFSLRTPESTVKRFKNALRLIKSDGRYNQIADQYIH